jgi:hypothetical protein
MSQFGCKGRNLPDNGVSTYHALKRMRHRRRAIHSPSATCGREQAARVRPMQTTRQKKRLTLVPKIWLRHKT